ALIFRAVVIGRHHDAHAGYLIVQWNEPGPMVFLAIKNQRVATRRTWIPDTSHDLRENRRLTIVAAAKFLARNFAAATIVRRRFSRKSWEVSGIQVRRVATR